MAKTNDGFVYRVVFEDLTKDVNCDRRFMASELFDVVNMVQNNGFAYAVCRIDRFDDGTPDECAYVSAFDNLAGVVDDVRWRDLDSYRVFIVTNEGLQELK